jgi:hypothetical protein
VLFSGAGRWHLPSSSLVITGFFALPARFAVQAYTRCLRRDYGSRYNRTAPARLCWPFRSAHMPGLATWLRRSACIFRSSCRRTGTFGAPVTASILTIRFAVLCRRSWLRLNALSLYSSPAGYEHVRLTGVISPRRRSLRRSLRVMRAHVAT